MKLSTPIFQLKRRAKLMARRDGIPLHQALDHVASTEGFSRWSLLSSRLAASSLPRTLLRQLSAGELLLMAGRPGHGKTTLGLELLLEAARSGRKACFFTLESTEPQVRSHLARLSPDNPQIAERIDILTSEDIGADYIIRQIEGSPRETIAVIDYLQILDQRRDKPPLAEQAEALHRFAGQAGIIMGFVSQIDRTYDPETRRLPDLRDIRRAGHLDLRLFHKACFLHGGEAQLQAVA